MTQSWGLAYLLKAKRWLRFCTETDLRLCWRWHASVVTQPPLRSLNSAYKCKGNTIHIYTHSCTSVRRNPLEIGPCTSRRYKPMSETHRFWRLYSYNSSYCQLWFLARPGEEKSREAESWRTQSLWHQRQRSQREPWGKAPLVPPTQGQQLHCSRVTGWVTESSWVTRMKMWPDDSSSCLCVLHLEQESSDLSLRCRKKQGVEQNKPCRSSPAWGERAGWSLLFDFYCVNKSQDQQGGKQHILASVCAEQNKKMPGATVIQMFGCGIESAEHVVVKLEMFFHWHAPVV